MFKNCKEGKCTKKCLCCLIAKILVIIGGINWGLIGLGALLGSLSSWNLVDFLFGSGSIIGSIIYLLVGLSAIKMLFILDCKKCCPDNCSVPMDKPAVDSTNSM